MFKKRTLNWIDTLANSRFYNFYNLSLFIKRISIYGMFYRFFGRYKSRMFLHIKTARNIILQGV